ncbi:MAG: hypothetical protein ABS939_14245 [Psychrobacillus sp.]
MEELRFKNMCDKCFHTLDELENIYGFKVIDGTGQERIVKGHKDCVEEIMSIMKDIYGEGEKDGEGK